MCILATNVTEDDVCQHAIVLSCNSKLAFTIVPTENVHHN